jgi:hypothetical protein
MQLSAYFTRFSGRGRRVATPTKPHVKKRRNYKSHAVEIRTRMLITREVTNQVRMP